MKKKKSEPAVPTKHAWGLLDMPANKFDAHLARRTQYVPTRKEMAYTESTPLNLKALMQNGEPLFAQSLGQAITEKKNHI